MIQYVLFLEALKPDAFVFENVSNFQSALRTPGGVLDAPEVLRSLIAELSNEDASYHVSCRVLNAKDFSVPQDRRRFIMVGVNAKKSLPRVVEEFFASSVSRQSVSLNAALWALGTPLEFALGGDVRVGDEVACFDMSSDGMATEVAEYWNWVRQPSPNKRKPPRHTDGHVYRRMRSDDAAFLRFVAPNTRWMDLKIAGTETLEELRTFIEKARDEIGTRELKKQAGVWLKSINDEFWLKILLEHVSRKYGLAENHLLGSTYLKNGAGTHGDWFERLSASKPSKTIVAHIGKDTYGYFHPFENRAISIREAARIQSFPDFYRFGSAGVVDAYSIIGNAVPPLLARHFAVVLANLHEKHRIFDDADRFAVVRTQPPQQESLSL
jgi:site-specific DNA-cytosine methylase